MSSKFSVYVWLFFVCVICVLIYLPGLQGPLFLDDNPQLNPLIERVNEGKEGGIWEYLFSRSGVFGRPVAMFTFIINALMFGGDVWYWKLVNLLIHIITGMVLFLFTYRIVRNLHSVKSAQYIALLTAAIWLLHPLQVSTVLYTVQRMAQLSTLFIFLGLLFYANGRSILEQKPRRGWLFISVSMLLFFPLSILSKENGILFPLLVFCTEALVFRFNLDKQQKKYLVTFFLFVLWIPLVLGLLYLAVNPERFLSGYVAREFMLSERLLTQLRVLVLYIFQLLVPIESNLGFFHDDLEISKSIFMPIETLYSLVLLVGIFVVSLLFRKCYPLITFGVMFYFSAHLLESTIFPLELMFEHRNYLASYGVFLTLSVLLFRIFSQRQGIVKIIPVVFLLFSSLTLAFRVQAWSSEYTMYMYMSKQRPDSKRLTTIMANIYADNGQYEKARELLTRFDSPGFKVNLLYIACKQFGRLDSNEFEGVRINKDTVVNLYANEAIINLANLGLDDYCKFDSLALIGLIDRALTGRILDDLSRQNLLMYKAHFLHRENRLHDAVAELDKAYFFYMDNPMPLFLAAEWYIDKGMYGIAKKYYIKAVEVAKESGRDYSIFVTRVGDLFSNTKN